MYPLLRLGKVLWQAKKAPELHYLDKSTISLRCHPWDLDMFNEMNNGRILTLFDLGRFDLAMRCGLMATLKRQRWALVVAGSSVRYRKRIKAWDKITMHSQYLGHDERWMYLSQSMWVGDNPCCSVLIRSGVTGKQGLIAPEQVITSTGHHHQNPELPSWVKDWASADNSREWPPNTQ